VLNFCTDDIFTNCPVLLSLHVNKSRTELLYWYHPCCTSCSYGLFESGINKTYCLVSDDSMMV